MIIKKFLKKDNKCIKINEKKNIYKILLINVDI